MAITNPQIRIKLIDLTAKDDSTPTSTDKQTFVTVSDIKTSFVPVKYATLEDGQWEFGKQFKILPDDLTTVDWGYWSLSQSDSSGVFASTPPELEVTFSTTHTSNGITIDFWSVSNDYCDDVDIYWYNASDVLITSKNFTPDNISYFCNELVEDYKRVVIKFNGTNKAYRYVKIQNIEYGELAIFDQNSIDTSDLLEEVDLTTDTVSINTLDFKVNLPTADRTDEILTVLQETQEIEVIEFVNSVPSIMGTFYVSSKEKEEETVLRIEGEDLIGQLESTEHLGGLYSSTPVEGLIDEIMAEFGTDKYTIDSSIASLTVSGWLPIQSCKDSLQDVAFAVNAVIDCSRGENIRIYRLDTSSVVSLNRNELFSYKETDVKKQIKPVTGVSLSLKSYVQVTTTVDLYKETLDAGTHTIEFTKPSDNLAITGGTIVESNNNYAEISVASTQLVTITGYEYEENITKVQKTATVASGIKPNIIKFENTLTWDIDQNAEYLKDYETQSHEIMIDKVTDDVQAGDYVTVEGYNSKTFTGFIVSNDIDLSNGFRGNMRAIGTIT